MRTFVFFVALVLLVACQASAQPLRLRLNNNSDWDIALDVTNLTGAAGTDFATDIESLDGAQQMWLQNTGGNWRVDVSRADTTWHPSIRVYVRRTSDGTGGTTISGGTAYQEITTVDTSFFTGTGNPRDINLQFSTNGAFAGGGVPAGSYLTTVTYTITDNL